jgi:uncharacterized protein
MADLLIWADIPVTDMDRARRFYSQLLKVPVEEMPGSNGMVAVPTPDDGQSMEGTIAFDLAMGENQRPSAEGATVYLDSMGDIEGMVGRVEPAGGKVLQPPMDMGPIVGRVAFAMDSEGNRIGFRAPSSA